MFKNNNKKIEACLGLRLEGLKIGGKTVLKKSNKSRQA